MFKYYLQVLRKYATFSGRAQRAEYWYFTLVNLIIYFLVFGLNSLVLEAIAGTGSGLLRGFLLILGTLGGIYGLAVIIPSLAVTVRRLHDTGRSGGWFFISFVPLVGPIILLVFTVLDSNPGDNKYGPNPKGAGTPAPTPEPPKSVPENL